MVEMTVLRLKCNITKKSQVWQLQSQQQHRHKTEARSGTILSDTVAWMLWYFKIGSKDHVQYGFMHVQFQWYAIKIEIKPKINCYYLSLIRLKADWFNIILLSICWTHYRVSSMNSVQEKCGISVFYQEHIMNRNHHQWIAYQLKTMYSVLYDAVASVAVTQSSYQLTSNQFINQ